MGLKVSYASKKLEKQCTKPKEMAKAFGGDVCSGLKRRLTELYAAEKVGDLYSGPGRWHEYEGDKISARLTGNWRLVIRPDEMDPECVSVEVVAVEDYH